MKKIKVKKTTIEVPDELRKMAIDIVFMHGFPSIKSVDKTLERALRLGLAHLLVLEEEDAKWRMKYGS